MRNLAPPSPARFPVAVSVARALRLLPPVAALACLLTACDSGDARTWSGAMDTLSSGEIVVHNTDDPLWGPEEEWRVVEDLRIGSATSDGPDLFGLVYSFDVDAWGRIFVLDDQAQEVRVFDRDGAFVRTVGRKGGGPGEFTQAGSVGLSRDGKIWVMGMGKGSVSIFDTAGTYLRDERTKTGGMVFKPYPGRFDPMGRYNVVVPRIGEEGDISFALARFDQDFTPIDTIPVPEDPVKREIFELVNEEGTSMTRAGVPFQGSLVWRFSRSGTLWTLVTDRYEFAEIAADGGTLRRVAKEHGSIPVSSAEREEALEGLDWFRNQGGKIDPSKIPTSKPPTVHFFLDDEGNLWVQRGAANSEDEGRLFDILDPEGRYLGTLRLPFSLQSLTAEPLVRDGTLYGITSDELGVPYLVRGRIERL